MTEIHVQETWVALAKAAQVAAYAPYSKFAVGSVLVDADGRVFQGCNVENVSFGATICAERNALGQAILHGSRRFRAVVVVTSAPQPVFPCGICRQMLAEFGTDLRVIVSYAGDQRVETTLAELLPRAFEAKDID